MPLTVLGKLTHLLIMSLPWCEREGSQRERERERERERGRERERERERGRDS